MLITIHWNINPEIVHVGGFAIRYYSLCFMAAFICSYELLQRIYKREHLQKESLNKLAAYIIFGTIIGARLGDCLFYDWAYFKQVPWEIVLPFRIQNGHFEMTGFQGLSSHGGAIGILIAVWLYHRKYHVNILWLLDRLGIVAALSGAFIRTGNFFNSEIIGKPSNLPWAVVFDRADALPRHPAMLYEAAGYLIAFFVLRRLYKISFLKEKAGLLFGIFLTLIFSLRFMIEFVKETQEAFENSWPLNLGQLLSIPFIIAGCWLIIRKYKFPKKRVASKTGASLRNGLPVLILLLSLTLQSGITRAQIPQKIKTIIIDAGHGGKDEGAHGDYEGSLHSKEKNITLAISLKLVARLKKDMPEVNIIPTRTTDIYQSPIEKAGIANNNHGDLFICIHADAVRLKTGSRVIGHRMETYTTARYAGKGRNRKKIVTLHKREVPVIEYYKIPTDRRGTSCWMISAAKTQDKMNAVKESDFLFDTEETDSMAPIKNNTTERSALALLYTQNYFKSSYSLASYIENEVAATGRPALGVNQRQKGIWVLQATQMPAVLIEAGFISNYDDERYLNSEKGQQEIADAIARALIKFKNKGER